MECRCLRVFGCRRRKEFGVVSLVSRLGIGGWVSRVMDFF